MVPPAEDEPVAERGRARRRSVQRAALSALAAVAVRGSWALYVNLPAGRDRALRAALLQMAWSAVAMFTVTMVQEALFRLGGTPRRGFWLSATGAITLGVGLGTLVHTLGGTPNVLLTMAPSAVLATVTFTAYAWGLRVSAESKLTQRRRGSPPAGRVD